MPFQVATDLSLEPVHYTLAWGRLSKTNDVPEVPDGARYMAGGFFGFTGSHADMFLHSLPPIIHIRRESDKAAMRWALERLREELRDPQPGSSLLAQQLAYAMLIQALRLHLADGASAGLPKPNKPTLSPGSTPATRKLRNPIMPAQSNGATWATVYPVKMVAEVFHSVLAVPAVAVDPAHPGHAYAGADRKICPSTTVADGPGPAAEASNQARKGQDSADSQARIGELQL